MSRRRRRGKKKSTDPKAIALGVGFLLVAMGIGLAWRWFKPRYLAGSFGYATRTAEGLLVGSFVRFDGEDEDIDVWRMDLLDAGDGSRLQRVVTGRRVQCRAGRTDRLWCLSRDGVSVRTLPTLEPLISNEQLLGAHEALAAGLAPNEPAVLIDDNAALVLTTVHARRIALRPDAEQPTLQTEELERIPPERQRLDYHSRPPTRTGSGSYSFGGQLNRYLQRTAQRQPLGEARYFEPSFLADSSTGDPIRLDTPGFLVTHRASLAADAPLVLSRVGLDGTAQWNWTTPRGRLSWAGFFAEAGVVVVIIGNQAYAVEAHDGTQRWQSDL